LLKSPESKLSSVGECESNAVIKLKKKRPIVEFVMEKPDRYFVCPGKISRYTVYPNRLRIPITFY